MRLTKTIRAAFVRAAMDDVPRIDYDSQAQEIAEKTLVELMPASIKKLLKDKDAEPWINQNWMCMPRRFSNFCGYGVRGDNEMIARRRPEVWVKIEELHALNEQQNEKIRQLRMKLEGCAESVTTRKALAELLPEFEKYLPADEKAAIKTLPAVANVVADFTAAGWPKGAKVARKAA